MKNIFIVVFLLRLAACQNSGIQFWKTDNNSTTSTATLPDATPIKSVPRDRSITAANSYSDLFLNTTAVEDFIKNTALPEPAAGQLRNFYNIRNYQYAWFASDGLTEQARSFWNLYTHNGSQHNNTLNKALDKKMDTLLTQDTIAVTATDTSFINTELRLTQQFFQTPLSNAGTNPEALAYYIPVRKVPVLAMADSLLNRSDSAGIKGMGQPYSLMKEQLRRYYTIAKDGGWQPLIIQTKKLKKGISSPDVTRIKKRLALTGDMSGGDTSRLYNDSLTAAIQRYQQRHGFTADGILTDSLLNDMNIPAEQRVQQLLVNMNRMLWMPAQLPDNLIEVNIPEFMLNVYEGTSKVFNMEVVVGKEGSNTMMFTGNLNQIVFSPYWNIPASIVRDEILPAMKQDPDYLASHHMEIVRKGDSLPVIRQLPGPDNALGKVKFLFPNSYDIYFHDTYAKELFQMNKRAFSHGCIRLADAEKMADYLLRNNPEWTPEKIQAAMNSGKEQFVKLQKPVPVIITYFTAWIDADGRLNFREDIYGHDKKLAGKMFTNTIPTL